MVMGPCRLSWSWFGRGWSATAPRSAQAGVPTTSVRYNGTLHDFMMLNPVRSSRAARAAVAQAVHVLREAHGTG